MYRRVNQKLPIPKALMTQLNEHTRSYMLFMIDGDGNPVIVSEVDDSAHHMALVRYIEKYTDAINEIENGQMIEALLPQVEEDGEIDE